jgi:integrase
MVQSTAFRMTLATTGFDNGGPPGTRILPGTPLLFHADWSVAEVPSRFIIERRREMSGSLNTARTYAFALRDFLESCNLAGLAWNEIAYEHILAFRTGLLDRRLSAKSINHRLAIIRSYYEWATFKGYCDRSPFPSTSRTVRDRLRLREEDVPPRAIPIEAINAILRCMAPRHALMAKLAVVSGLRAHEISGLPYAAVPDAGPDDPAFVKFKVRRKGGKITEVRIPRRMLNELTWYRDFDRYQAVAAAKQNNARYREPHSLFVSKAGLAFRPARLSKEFLRAKRAAGFSNRYWGFHSLRHTYGLTLCRQLQRQSEQLILAGKPGLNVLLILRDCMGHTRLESTQAYLTALEHDASAIAATLDHIYNALWGPS